MTVGALAKQQRESAAVAVFGTWMIVGLFLDGWAHDAEKPETFFSPWHGILYSGFVAAVVWFAWDGWRDRTKADAVVGPQDRLIAVGLITFIVGAVGDGFWHEIFGIEVDIEALVSPSHLALLIGGFLMVTSPIRLAAANPDYAPATWRRWFPQGITLTLATALVLFFTQYLSAFEYVGAPWHGSEDLQRADLATVMLTNAILILPLLYVLYRWRPPLGAFALLFTACALLLSGLEAFEIVEVVVAFLVAGVIADLCVAYEKSVFVTASVTSFVLWAGFFVMSDWSYDIGWSPELWAGSIVLATASSALLSALLRPASIPAGQGPRSADASAD